jgi:hypothetical protein
MKTRLLLSALLFSIVLNGLYGQPGSLDPTFGNGGIVTTDLVQV